MKGVPSSGTGVKVEELWQEDAILNFENRKGCFVNRTAQKQQQTWESNNTIRYSLHWGRSPQDGLRDV